MDRLDTEDLTSRTEDLLRADAIRTETELGDAVRMVLQQIVQVMKMQAAFLSEFKDGERVFRYVAQETAVAAVAEGAGDPREESWCQRVVDGRLPEYIADASKHPQAAPLLGSTRLPIRTHISVPVVLSTGKVFGTLCTFSLGSSVNPAPSDLSKLKLVARLTAQRIEGLAASRR